MMKVVFSPTEKPPKLVGWSIISNAVQMLSEREPDGTKCCSRVARFLCESQSWSLHCGIESKYKSVEKIQQIQQNEEEMNREGKKEEEREEKSTQ